MNPLTNMKNVAKLSERELESSSKTSWHDQYKDSAWIFVGGLPYDLTEGDIICIFSQYGEIVNINLVRAKETGKSRGFCFICYEDQRSTILAVDNFNGIKILNRIIRVDHVAEYKVPKEGKKTDEETQKLYSEGCAPKVVPVIPKVEPPDPYIRETIADQIESDIKLPARLPIYSVKQEPKEKELSDDVEKSRKSKKKKKKKGKKKSSKYSSSSSDTDSSEDEKRLKIKKENTEKAEKQSSHKSNKSIFKHKKREKSRERSRSRSKEKTYKSKDFAYVPKRYRN